LIFDVKSEREAVINNYLGTYILDTHKAIWYS